MEPTMCQTFNKISPKDYSTYDMQFYIRRLTLHLLLAFVFFFTTSFSHAQLEGPQASEVSTQGELPEIQLKQVERGTGYTISTFVIRSHVQLAMARAEIVQRIQRLKRVKPNAEVSIVAVNPETQGHEIKEVGQQITEELGLRGSTTNIESTPAEQSRLARAKNFLRTNADLVTMTLVTSVVTGGATTVAMFYGDSLSPTTSLSLGVLWASVSGGYIFYNQKFQEWLRKTSRIESWIIDKLHITNRSTIQNLRSSGEWGKYFSHILGWNVVGVLASSVLERSLQASPLEVLTTTIAEVTSGAPWELAIAAETERAKLRNPENSRRIQSMSNFASMVTEVIAQSLSVAALSGLQKPALIGLTVMTATGGIYYLKTFIQSRLDARPVRSCRALYGLAAG
jgi:hypothetical protein